MYYSQNSSDEMSHSPLINNHGKCNHSHFSLSLSCTWVFDDEKVGLLQEPFVGGMPEIIDLFVQEIPDAQQGFKLLFSATPFPGYQAILDWKREEIGGNWYCWEERQLEGWLCPALYKYFPQAPSKIYCRCEPLTITT